MSKTEFNDEKATIRNTINELRAQIKNLENLHQSLENYEKQIENVLFDNTPIDEGLVL